MASRAESTKSEKALDNYTRAQIFNYVFRNPGADHSKIKSATDFYKGLVYYHLGILKQAGYVKSIAGGNSNFYYAAGQESSLLDRLKEVGIPKTLEKAIIANRKNLHSLRA